MNGLCTSNSLKKIAVKLAGKIVVPLASRRRRFISRNKAYKIAVENRQITARGYAPVTKDLRGSNVEAGEWLCGLEFNAARTDKKRTQK